MEFTEPGRPAAAVGPTAPTRPSPLTVVALVLLASALVAALVGVWTFLVWGLAGASLVVGLSEVRRKHLAGQPLRWPIVLASVAGGVFLAAILAPGLLGPRYRAAADSAPEPSEIQVVPHPNYTHETDQRATDWVNASRASLRQGRVRVEVSEVWNGPSAKTPGREPAARWLYVRVRLYRGRTGAEIAAGAFAKSLAWDDTVRATLRDAAGNTFHQLPVRPSAARAGGAGVAAGTSIDVTDEVLAFPVPPDAGSELRLELPAAAWGGSGVFRFALPAEMIQHHPAPSGGKKGS